MSKFDLHLRAQECIAQGSLTNSKRPESLIMGVYPTHMQSGKGCYMYDVHNRRYIDYITGLGTNLFGYANPTINMAVKHQLDYFGPVLSLATVRELEAAEMLKSMFPFIDCVKYLKTGTEACMAAVRIARAKTGRKHVLTEAYHGWSDEFVFQTPPAIGVPSADYMNKLSDFDIDESIAAVIVEPVVTDMSTERIEWLKKLREDCTKHGVLLIFDEIITGFRFPRFSVSSYLGITPDIICLGKAIGGGMPLAAVGGKYDVMNGAEYFVSSTFAGDPVALAASKAVMDMLLKKKADIDWLWERGQEFLDQFNALWPEKIRIEGYPTRGIFKGDDMVKGLLWQEACKAGILFGPSWWMNFPLVEETHSVISTCKDIINRIQNNQVTLEGSLPRSPFAQRSRDGQGKVSA